MRLRHLPLVLALVAAPAFAQTGFDPDTVRAAPLDGGKMWLFEDPPTDYLEETYGFAPTDAWFETARLATLRMPGCTASFVSADGLVATNHHCVQGSVVAVDQGGEGLLDSGFIARSRAEERRIPDMYVDQLVAFEDVTDEVLAAIDAAEPDDRSSAQEAAEAAIQGRLLTARGQDPDVEDGDFVVQTVGLYNGGRYSAYTFRRFRDVRLVMAPEASLGYFGGDFDNFTYPRYALDAAFMRVYEDGVPFQTDHYFSFSETGVSEDDLVFVVGNPGRTQRGLTVAQLEYLRDVELPGTLAFIDSRAAALQAYLATGQDPNPDQVRSGLFGLLNAQKAFGGRLRGLRDPYIIARRQAAQDDFLAASAEAGPIVAELAEVQAAQREGRAARNAFGFLGNRRYGSALMRRALAIAGGGDAADIENQADMVERAFLTAEIEALQAFYGRLGDAAPKPLQTDTETAVDFLLTESALADGSTAPADDPALVLVTRIQPDIDAWRSASRQLAGREAALNQDLGRARFAAFGASVPPDATFSLRFTDGVVTGYDYNGTQAPPMTTLFGLYDRYYSFCATEDRDPCDWALPQRWLDAAPRLDMTTPVNFTSTSDTIGGNSGSPTINRDGDLVGLNFDRTIEGLVRDYLYAPERGRNVMVDARIVIEALRNVYGLDALADEATGR